MLQGLGKAKPRIEDDLFGRNTHNHTLGNPLSKKPTHLANQVVVMRIVLHVAGLTQHMHQADGQAGRSGRIKSTVALKRAHVVDQPSPQTRGFAHHCRGGGVYRDDDIQLTGNTFDHGRHPL